MWKRGMRGSKKCQIERYVTGERSLVHETQDPKAKENKLRQKNLTLWFVLIEKMVFGSTSKLRFQRQKITLLCGLIKKKGHFWGFQVFDFALYLKSKTRKPGKLGNYFDWSKHRKTLNFNWILN